MSKINYYFLSTLQIVSGYFVLSNYFTALKIVYDQAIPEFLAPFYGIGFALAFVTENPLLLLLLIYALPGLLFVLISVLKYRQSNKRINVKKLIVPLAFVSLSYISILFALGYESMSTKVRLKAQKQSVQNIQTAARNFFYISFTSINLPQSTTKEGTLVLNAADNSSIPKGKYMLIITSDISETPIIRHMVNIQETLPYLVLSPAGLLDYNESFGEVEAIQDESSVVVRFQYDNSGPAKDLKSITIQLKYQETGIYNDEIFYIKDIDVN